MAEVAEKPTEIGTAVAPLRPRSVLMDMSDRFGMEPAAFEATVRHTVVPKECTREEFAAFLLVARDYGLNPLTKEIYAFPKKGGGIQPIVGVDGWIKLMNRSDQFDGIEFSDRWEGGNLIATTAAISRKDRAKPIVVTEYMAECSRGTEPWNKWPARMLRHKALMQCARVAFGFSGLMDEDEFDRSGMVDVTPLRSRIAPPRPTREEFSEPTAADEAAADRAAMRVQAGEDPATVAATMGEGADDVAGDAVEPMPIPMKGAKVNLEADLAGVNAALAELHDLGALAAFDAANRPDRAAVGGACLMNFARAIAEAQKRIAGESAA